MPSEEDIASTIDELTRKLDNVPEEKIRQELERFLDHGVPLHQAKQDIQRTLGQGSTSSRSTPTEPVARKVDEIETSDQNINLVAKVVHVNEREITARGEQKTIWSGLLGDETGVVSFTAWRDIGLEKDDVLELENAYVTTWQGDPQVNIGDHATVRPAEVDLDVPSAADRSVDRDIGELEDGMGSVSVTGRILSVNEREVNVKGEPRTLWEGEIADETGRINYTAWHDFELAEDDVIRIDNGYVRSFRGLPQLNFGENGRVTREDASAVPPADALTDVASPEPQTDAHDIGDLTPGMSAVQVTGRLLKVNERDVNVKGEARTLWEGEIADETGRIPYTSWTDHALEEGQVVRVDNAYVRSFRGLPQLNFGENASLDELATDQLPPTDELAQAQETTVEAVQAAQGAVGVAIDATVLEIRDGSGLILRCPECRRVLRQGECQMHGRVEGVTDLRVKAIIDDGTGAVTAVFDRPATERLLSKSLEEAEQIAEDAMTFDVILDEIKQDILLKRVRVEGNATHDDYGTTFMVNAFAVLEPEDVEARAETLIEKVDATMEDAKEVSA